MVESEIRQELPKIIITNRRATVILVTIPDSQMQTTPNKIAPNADPNAQTKTARTIINRSHKEKSLAPRPHPLGQGPNLGEHLTKNLIITNVTTKNRRLQRHLQLQSQSLQQTH